jgi:hypothetical protein
MCEQGSPKGLVALLFYFIIFHSVYFYNTPQVLVGPPQGVDGLAILFHIILVYFDIMHQVLVGLAQGVGDVAI